MAAEKLPDFKMEMEQLKDIQTELSALIGDERAGELITAARGRRCANLRILLSRRAGGRHPSKRNDRAVEEALSTQFDKAEEYVILTGVG